jgi:hypothetical protein
MNRRAFVAGPRIYEVIRCQTLAFVKKLDDFTLRARPRDSLQRTILVMITGAPLARILVHQISQ